MLPRLTAALLALSIGPVAAFGAEWLTDIHALAYNPRAYYAKTITVEGMQCIDTSQGYQCVKNAGNRMVRIDAPFMGSSTDQQASERIESWCRENTSQMRPQCRMTVVFTPRTHEEQTIDLGQGAEVMIAIIADSIDLRIEE